VNSAPTVAVAAAPGPAAALAPVRIPEIDGLRGVAIAMIVIYHVWLNRVSGGVDVFFLLSGLLITGSLLRTVERSGRVRLAGFYTRVARRLFPAALAVLTGVILATVVWLPQTRWRDTLGDVVAAATYWVNWRLAGNAVDYLASQNAASPVQHYWSLAVQGQFYLAWPLLFLVAVLLASRLSVRPRRVLAVLLALVFAGSLAYSVHRTATVQVYTYFDTLARLWEFALGGLLALALPYLRLRRGGAVPLGWLGLVALIVCGVVLRAGSQFPGWTALWPTLAAAALVVSADTGSRFGADRLLRARSLRRLGDLSYALYLWHWPVLICYLAATDSASPSARGGLLIIGVSLLLAAATKRLVEEPPTHSARDRRTDRAAFALTAACLAVVLVTATGWTAVMDRQQQREAQAAGEFSLGAYPGAAYVERGGDLPDVPYRPGPLRAKEDHARMLYPGCHQDPRGVEVIRCELGDPDGERTIAVVGGSRSQHWLPALEAAAWQQGWRIISMTKSSCLFSAEEQYLDGEVYVSCARWNQAVLAELAVLRPDAVFATSTRVTANREFTPDGYLSHWRTLNQAGIPVLGIRDVPRADRDIPECVERYGPDGAECTSDPQANGLAHPAEVESRPDVPANVMFLDLTRYFCDERRCPPTIGNLLVYHDRSHITATYARTLAPFLAEQILSVTGW
jgi:peptidoglycan/LPS O-acetylase OafA/YrhL